MNFAFINSVPSRHILLCVWLATASVGISSLAMADTISQSITFRLNAVTASEVLDFASFDATQGTIQSIDVSLDATRRDDWAVWNALPRPRSISYQTSLTGTTLTVNGNAYAFADDLSGPGATPVLAAGAGTFASESAAGEAQFLAGLDPVFPSAFQLNSTVSFTNILSLPKDFDGELNLAFDPGQWNWTGGSNVFVDSLVDVSGTATVNYTFISAKVPESPVGLALVGLVWLGMLMIGGRRRLWLRA